MSPRDTLKRITVPFSSSRAQPLPSDGDGDIFSRLSSLAAEAATSPVRVFPEAQAKTRRAVKGIESLLLIGDAVALGIGFLASWLLASLANDLFFGRNFVPLWGNAGFDRAVLYVLMSAGTLLWLAHKGHYRARLPFWTEAQQICKAYAFAMMADGFVQFATKQDFSRVWLISGWFVAAGSTILLRGVVRKLLRRTGLWQIRTLLVGSGATADEARAALRSEPVLGYEIVSQVENLSLLLQQVGGSWCALCARFGADHVVIALDGPALAEAEDAMASLSREDLSYAVMPPLRHLPVLGMAPHYFFNYDVMLLAPTNNLEKPLAQMTKRAIDLLFSSSALLALSPLFLILGWAVRRDGGPVFFGDDRLGAGGKAFRCLKFRSMIVNADAVLHRYFEKNPDKKAEWAVFHKLRDGDPRVTKVGRIMRRLSLDELPQLINVLRGDMSLVGPRPIMPREREGYGCDFVHYERVRPGLTGLWQVSGRSQLSFERRVQMDVWYVRNWSLWHDVAILCKTLPAIWNKTGAC